LGLSSITKLGVFGYEARVSGFGVLLDAGETTLVVCRIASAPESDKTRQVGRNSTLGVAGASLTFTRVRTSCHQMLRTHSAIVARQKSNEIAETIANSRRRMIGSET